MVDEVFRSFHLSRRRIIIIITSNSTTLNILLESALIDVFADTVQH